MTRHITILGIDGSGKSSLVKSLPAALAATQQGLVGGATDKFQVVGAEEDLLLDGFTPDALPPSAKLARRFKRIAKALVNSRFFYPFFKLAQMIFQDRAARVLARKYKTNAFVSDGNALLCAAGRAGNYLFPASTGDEDETRAPSGQKLADMVNWLAEGGKAPDHRLRGVRSLRRLQRFSSLFGVRALWLPDDIVFLDVTPDEAARRISARGEKMDQHENPDDMAQARRSYLAVLDALARLPKGPRVHVIQTGDMSAEEVLRHVTERFAADNIAAVHEEGEALHEAEEELEGNRFWAKVFNPRYLLSYLVPRLFEDAWREPFFALSSMGRRFLRDGYSAGIMKVIYDNEPSDANLSERAFLEYPLHRAVRDRLPIVVDEIEMNLRDKLSKHGMVRVLTAPSGYAYDIFQAIERIGKNDAKALARIELLAVDLDPTGEIQTELHERAKRLGLRFDFVRGDISAPETQNAMRKAGPVDLTIFVGLSSWLDKPGILGHMRFLREVMAADGTLLSDCFTPAPYALSGRYVGYKASYFTPDVYTGLVGLAGFERNERPVRPGRDHINHVLMFRPAPTAQNPLRLAA